jgi:hypothetical protein
LKTSWITKEIRAPGPPRDYWCLKASCNFAAAQNNARYQKLALRLQVGTHPTAPGTQGYQYKPCPQKTNISHCKKGAGFVAGEHRGTCFHLRARTPPTESESTYSQKKLYKDSKNRHTWRLKTGFFESAGPSASLPHAMSLPGGLCATAAPGRLRPSSCHL